MTAINAFFVQYGIWAWLGFAAWSLVGLIVLINVGRILEHLKESCKFFRFGMFCAACGICGWVVYLFYVLSRIAGLVTLEDIATWLTGGKKEAQH